MKKEIFIGKRFNNQIEFKVNSKPGSFAISFFIFAVYTVLIILIAVDYLGFFVDKADFIAQERSSSRVFWDLVGVILWPLAGVWMFRRYKKSF